MAGVMRDVGENKDHRTADRFLSIREHACDRHLSLLHKVSHVAEQGAQIVLCPAEQRTSQQDATVVRQRRMASLLVRCDTRGSATERSAHSPPGPMPHAGTLNALLLRAERPQESVDTLSEDRHARRSSIARSHPGGPQCSHGSFHGVNTASCVALGRGVRRAVLLLLLASLLLVGLFCLLLLAGYSYLQALFSFRFLPGA